jgi:iron-sulfur cluster assembly accessory protein
MDLFACLALKRCLRCSGFAYKFSLIDAPEDEADMIFERDGVTLVVDELSYDYLRGSTVDYTMELIKRAFTVAANPNAEAGCGCGISFSLKD